jgi:hypothetical protein
MDLTRPRPKKRQCKKRLGLSNERPDLLGSALLKDCSGPSWFCSTTILFHHNFPCRIDHVGYELTRPNWYRRYWIIIMVITIQYRHRRLWLFYQNRHYNSLATTSFWRSYFFIGSLYIDGQLWWFSVENEGSQVSIFLLVGSQYYYLY